MRQALTSIALALCTILTPVYSQQKPNIIILYADDLGYGDLQCYNPSRGKIHTPQMNKLAAEGMRFTDAHSGSSICTPSRYTILTGRYHWRTHLQNGVFNGMSQPLIPADRLTIASVLKQHGYATACIGKWHLGMNMPSPLTEGTIKDGPMSNGFDRYFGISASLDMPPYAFIENDHFTEAPTAVKNLMILTHENANSREGPAAPSFESEQVLPQLVEKSVDWIKTHKEQPFFLYVPFTSPHIPLAPTKEWKGKSGLGDYADFVMQTDDAVGKILAAVDAIGATQNTLVILSSDNGPASYVGTKVSENPRNSYERKDAMDDLKKEGHYPSGPLRGYKATLYEGGHRVPFIVRWPSTVKAGSVSNQLVHQADLIRTIADIVGTKLPDNAGEDSFSLLPLLQGGDKPIREHAISATGIPSLRVGPWKYIAAPDTVRFQKGKPNNPPVQLYNLDDDLKEDDNLAETMPEKVAEMKDLLEKLITDGRSTPGSIQKNDVNVIRYPKRKK
jgi:arylsulfatase A